jgi:Flp pilus assembly protein TadG
MTSKKYSERGQALVLIALAAIVLFGFVALAIDGSAKLSDRRHAQNAADTAALAAALEKVTEITKGTSDNSPTTGAPATCPPPTGVLPSPVCEALQLAGLDRAASNGYDNDLTTNTVEVHSPPISGYYVGDTEYVQVIITSDVKTYFARIFGFDETTNILQAVAYTKKGGNLADGAMIISYDPSPNCSTGGTGGYSVSVSGSSTVNLNGGGFFLNSDEVCGFVIPNCADLNIFGGSINSVGNNIDTGACTFDPSLTPKINQDPVIIPDDVYWPDVPPECSQTPNTPVKLGEVSVGPGQPVEEWLLSPGFYTDFPSPSLVANKSHIYLKSGVYCIDPPMNQDLSWSPIDAAILNGSIESNPSKTNYNKYHAYNPDGVTLYIRSGGGFTINSNNPTYIDASTDGDYQGYLIILEGTHTSHPACSISGGADIHLDGLIFAPYCDITVNGGSDPTAEINAQLIGWDIKINGTTTINFNYDPSNQVKIKRKVGLMK